MTVTGIGAARPRDEDLRLTTGAGLYTDDRQVENAAHLVVVRSPYAAARITGIDTQQAQGMPGVLAILTARDVMADGIGLIEPQIAHKRAGGKPMAETPVTMLAGERVRYVGDPVAVVVAATLAQAEDAAEAVAVDYDMLDAVCNVSAAAASGAPAVWDETPDNIAFEVEVGDRDEVEAAFARADHVARLDFPITRVAIAAMEPRLALAVPEEDGRFTFYTGTQMPHRTRASLAKLLSMEESAIRVVVGDVGGSFGMKNAVTRELVLTLWAAKRLKRAVRWVPSRGESFLADPQARDTVSTVELALDRDGTFLALRVKTLAALGAYIAPAGPVPPIANLGGLAGVYRTPAIFAHVVGVLTNTQSTAPYRGAGRPEATYTLERIIDVAAREMGIARDEIRRRNLIAPDQMPYDTGFVFSYDSGNFPKGLEMALEASDWAGFEARREDARARGRLLGRAVVNSIESAAGPIAKPLPEYAEVRFNEDGDATLYLGAGDVGMGHATSFRQIAAGLLGLEHERIGIVAGDTDLVKQGVGSFGSRTMATGGGAVSHAADEIIRRAMDMAAERLEAAAEDIEFAEGAFRIKGTDRAVKLRELAANANGALDVSTMTAPEAATFPNGCHVCEAEIDPETGAVAVTRYTVVDDVGTVINPLTMKGQIHGGVAQGLGQALGEVLSYDAASGQLLTGSFMDYQMPRADDVPAMEVLSNPVPTPMNPLGAKGAGEAGTVGALAAVSNAVIDALSDYGIGHLDMPASPERVWRAIQGAGAR